MIDTPKPPRVSLPIVCSYLRTKTSFGTMEPGGPDWRAGSTTAVYWCLRTMETAGPDDGFAHAQRCREGRSCFSMPTTTIIA
jgi:hypothetical protein